MPASHTPREAGEVGEGRKAGRSTAIAGGAQRAAWTGIIVNARVKIEVVGHLEAHRVVREQLQLEDERHRHERERGHRQPALRTSSTARTSPGNAAASATAAATAAAATAASTSWCEVNLNIYTKMITSTR